MYLRLLYECAARAEPVDGGPVAYAHQINAEGVQYRGAKIQGEYSGSQYVQE